MDFREASYIISTFKLFHFQIFSFTTTLTPNVIVIFSFQSTYCSLIVHLCFTYLKWCGVGKWTSSPKWVSSSDSYNSKFNFSLSQVKKWLDFGYSLELNMFHKFGPKTSNVSGKSLKPAYVKILFLFQKRKVSVVKTIFVFYLYSCLIC